MRTVVAHVLRHARGRPRLRLAERIAVQALLDDESYRNTAGLSSLVERSVEAIEALPGVESAAAGCCLPLGSVPNVSFGIVGRDEPGDRPRANVPTISPSFFEVSRIPLLQGRAFTSADDASSPKVVILNETAARQHWPSGGALGAQITIGAGGVERHEVVGIVGDVRDRADGLTGPTIYTPLAQSPDAGTLYNVRRPTHWMVRTSMSADLVREAVKNEIERASGLPVIETQTMEQVLESSAADADFRLALMLVFGCLALALSAAGVYGLVSFDVAQRRQEVGVRLALGARGADIRRLVVLRVAKLSLAGLAAGFATAFALSGLLAGFLFGVEARDPLVFAASALVLSTTALAATALPALRASRVDPMAVLRQD